MRIIIKFMEPVKPLHTERQMWVQRSQDLGASAPHALQPAVSKPQYGIDTNHAHVEDVQVDYIVKPVKELVGNPCGVSGKNHEQEQDALAASLAARPRLVNGERPCCAKTEQHDDLKDAHLVSLPACAFSHPTIQSAHGETPFYLSGNPQARP